MRLLKSLFLTASNNKMEENIFTKNYPANSWGFSLIEILVVVSILVILVGLIAPGFNFFKRQSTLDGAAQEIIHALRLAQNKTLASEGNSNFGVYFEANKFVIFKGLTYSVSTTTNEIHSLDSSLDISAINFGGATAYVVFERLNGNTANYGSLTVKQTDNPSQSKIIYIDQSGAVSLAAILSSDTDRQKDSRHVEVIFSQNVKTAGILTLSFPAHAVTENINFQTYLNAGKTAFSWEDSVMVDGQEQKLKIHAHYLTDNSVLFCIHRDRRDNTEALNLNLDGQSLVNYAADGTVTSGISAWSGTAQIQ